MSYLCTNITLHILTYPCVISSQITMVTTLALTMNSAGGLTEYPIRAFRATVERKYLQNVNLANSLTHIRLTSGLWQFWCCAHAKYVESFTAFVLTCCWHGFSWQDCMFRNWCNSSNPCCTKTLMNARVFGLFWRLSTACCRGSGNIDSCPVQYLTDLLPISMKPLYATLFTSFSNFWFPAARVMV